MTSRREFTRLCLSALLCASGSQLAQAETRIDGSGNVHWRHFTQRMRQQLISPYGQPVRILQLGDSHTAGRHFPDRVRQRLQYVLGNGGIGLLPPGRPGRSSAPAVQVTPGPQWVMRQMRPRETHDERGHTAAGLGAFVGYGLSAYQTLRYQFSGITGTLRFYVYFDPGTMDPPAFKLYLEQRERRPIDEKTAGRSVFQLPATEAAKQLTLLSRGNHEQARLFGVTALCKQPGVVFSSIGVNGASLSTLLEWDNPTTHRQLVDYAPELLILAFGTNDVVNINFVPEKFQQSLQDAAAWVGQHAPEAAVLLVLPPHTPQHGAKTHHDLTTARALMSRFATQQGWRSWDWSELTMAYGASLFQSDGIHLTPAGYETSGEALARALIASLHQRF